MVFETTVDAPRLTTKSARPLTTLSYLLFFLSGAAALIYQMSWTRQIGLLFGHTDQAAAVILGSFFAGMAVGNWVGAKLSSRMHPRLGYGFAELMVAAWACLVPILLSCSESPSIGHWLSSSSTGWQTAARVVFSFLLLLPATSGLGITLPMMAESISSPRECELAGVPNVGRVFLAYAVNTAGGLCGILFSMFFLALVGVRGSGYVAACISMACALVAFTLSLWEVGRKHSLSDDVTSDPKPAVLATRQSFFWLGLAALSGFGIVALEVLYARMFSLVFHNSTYTFGAVVAVILMSLAIGTALAGQLQRRYRVEGVAAWSASLGALATLLSVIVFVALTNLEYITWGNSFWQYFGGALGLVALVVAPPVTLLGMLLPLAWKAAGLGKGAGAIIGRLMATNTIAAAFGPLAASFLLLPTIGLWQSFVVVAASFFGAGFVLHFRTRWPAFAGTSAGFFLFLALLSLHSPVDAERGRMRLGEQIVRHWDSSYGWIDVVQLRDTGSLKVRLNLHYRFGETGNDIREFRQAHIPLLLHERPQDVLFLGLGTGLTAGGAIPHDEVKSVVAVELIPEVVEAAHFLADHNFGVVDHPKVDIRVDDARHYLLATDRRFDVIVSDLFVPWESESGYLYTVEHYRVAQQRLKSGGLFCQWLPLYQLGTREFEMIADSFATVFPITTIWWGDMDVGKPVIAVIGSDGPLRCDADRLSKRLDVLRRTTRSYDTYLSTVDAFYNNYQGDWERRNLTPLNTDEHPRVEFFTPLSSRDHKLVEGPILLEYFDRVLSKLPAEAASLHSAEKPKTSHIQRRRAWQRLILFGEARPEAN